MKRKNFDWLTDELMLDCRSHRKCAPLKVHFQTVQHTKRKEKRH